MSTSTSEVEYPRLIPPKWQAIITAIVSPPPTPDVASSDFIPTCPVWSSALEEIYCVLSNEEWDRLLDVYISKATEAVQLFEDRDPRAEGLRRNLDDFQSTNICLYAARDMFFNEEEKRGISIDDALKTLEAFDSDALPSVEERIQKQKELGIVAQPLSERTSPLAEPALTSPQQEYGGERQSLSSGYSRPGATDVANLFRRLEKSQACTTSDGKV